MSDIVNKMCHDKKFIRVGVQSSLVYPNNHENTLNKEISNSNVTERMRNPCRHRT